MWFVILCSCKESQQPKKRKKKKSTFSSSADQGLEHVNDLACHFTIRRSLIFRVISALYCISGIDGTFDLPLLSCCALKRINRSVPFCKTGTLTDGGIASYYAHVFFFQET